MSLQEIETVLARSARSGWSELRRMVWFYLAVMASGVLLSGWNCVSYRTNPGWLAALAGMVALLLTFIGYGVGMLREMRALDQPLDGLAIQVKRQMRLFRTRYQVWMGTVAAVVWLVCFGVSLQMHYEDGRYGVSIDGGLIAFSVMQAAIIYGLVRVAQRLLSQRLVAALEDLEAQVTERTERFEQSPRWQTVLLILAVIAGAALFSALLLHFLSRFRHAWPSNPHPSRSTHSSPGITKARANPLTAGCAFGSRWAYVGLELPRLCASSAF